MKLFQRLLIAPAALGLISPLAVNATEVNLNEIEITQIQRVLNLLTLLMITI